MWVIYVSIARRWLHETPNRVTRTRTVDNFYINPSMFGNRIFFPVRLPHMIHAVCSNGRIIRNTIVDDTITDPFVREADESSYWSLRATTSDGSRFSFVWINHKHWVRYHVFSTPATDINASGVFEDHYNMWMQIPLISGCTVRTTNVEGRDLPFL